MEARDLQDGAFGLAVDWIHLCPGRSRHTNGLAQGAFFSQLKLMAERLLKDRRHILVFVNRQATLIMPTGPVPIGEMSPQDGFVVRETFTAQGKHYIAERVPQRGGSGAGQDACSS